MRNSGCIEALTVDESSAGDAFNERCSLRCSPPSRWNQFRSRRTSKNGSRLVFAQVQRVSSTLFKYISSEFSSLITYLRPVPSTFHVIHCDRCKPPPPPPPPSTVFCLIQLSYAGKFFLKKLIPTLQPSTSTPRQERNSGTKKRVSEKNEDNGPRRQQARAK